MQVQMEVSPGELVDRITILEIKIEKIADTQKLPFVTAVAVASTRVGVTRVANQWQPDWESIDHDMPFYSFPNSTAGPCPMWRRELHDKYGLFCEEYQIISDGIMWEKWHAGGENFGLVDRRLALYLNNPKSLERRRDHQNRSLIQQEIKQRGSSESQ